MTPKTSDARRIRPHQDDARGPCAAAIRDYRAAWERVRKLLRRPAADPAPTEVGPRRRGWGAGGSKSVYRTPGGRYVARVRYAGRLHGCGTHDTEEAAGAAAAAKLAELEGGGAA